MVLLLLPSFTLFTNLQLSVQPTIGSITPSATDDAPGHYIQITGATFYYTGQPPLVRYTSTYGAVYLNCVCLL